jgi:hypothetical protein
MVNRNLILGLSLFGLFMAIGTVFWISYNIEPLYWLAIFIYCAVVIARKCHSKFFLHGFLVSMMNSVWMTAAHIIFFETYIANHPQEVAMMEKFPLPYSMRISMLLTGPAFGAVSGVILGLFCIIASKTIKRKKHAS